MARYKGLASFSANFEPQIAAPLDARSVVDVFSDLLENITWTANDGLIYAYKGMVVSVVNDLTPENNGLYLLIDEDYNNPDSWEKVNSQSEEPVDPTGNTVYTNLDGTPIEVGGIKIGEIFSGETMQEVFDRLFYPTLYPEIIEPYHTFYFVNPDDAFQEINSTAVTFTVRTEANLGSITPPYGTTGNRASGLNRIDFIGLSNGRVYDSVSDTYVNFVQNIPTTDLTMDRTVSFLTTPLTAGAKSLTCTIRFLSGEQPKDSKGNNYLSPSPTQSIAKGIILNPVHPYFATTSNITTLTKQKLEPHTKEYWEVDLVGETDTDKQIVQLPTAFVVNIGGIQFYNTISNSWEWLNGSKANSQSSFTKSVVVRDQHGLNVNYNQFVHNGSKVGARRLRFYRA